MRNLKIEEVKEVSGGILPLVIIALATTAISGCSEPGKPGSSGQDAQGNQVDCPGGTSAHMGDHGNYRGPHCDRID